MAIFGSSVLTAARQATGATPQARDRHTRPTGNPVYLISVSDVPIVLAPGRLLRVPQEMRAGDRVADADPGAAQAGGVFLSHVIARAIEAVCLLMVDSLDFETLMRVIP